MPSRFVIRALKSVQKKLAHFAGMPGNHLKTMKDPAPAKPADCLSLYLAEPDGRYERYNAIKDLITYIDAAEQVIKAESIIRQKREAGVIGLDASRYSIAIRGAKAIVSTYQKRMLETALQELGPLFSRTDICEYRKLALKTILVDLEDIEAQETDFCFCRKPAP